MSGRVPAGEFQLRLFPLPNLVFFPNTRLPLHIFEPRYRQLVTDAMSSDERIGMILLRSGWRTDYFGAPAIHDVGTMGIIEQVVKLDDGRYNLLLDGVTRFRILEETDQALYRTARVVALPERAPQPVDAWARREWLIELSRRYLELLPGGFEVPELDTANLESLVNALVMSLNLELEEKQGLLELDDLATRCDTVGTLLETRLEAMTFLAPYRRGDGEPGMN
ncbi:MAG TPA: LON peptidase substrate-binding domain-containing protein [Thermoanaerobaculia bacterium]|nr:LON peptidase substrate-binding domain-containing protein [Thermoanaerobaculia bacterium]